MVLSLLFSILLTYAGVWLTSQVFVSVFSGLLSTGTFSSLGDYAYYTAFLLIIFMFCYTVIGVIEMTMSLIHRVPSYTLRWLGVPVREYGEGDNLQNIKNAFVQQVQGVAQSGVASYGMASKETMSGIK